MKTLCLVVLIASAPAYSQISCRLTKGSAPTIRADGCEELIVFDLTCTGGTPTATGQPVPLVDVTVSVNADVSVFSSPSAAGFGDAVLTIDDPLPKDQKVAMPSSQTGLSYNGPAVEGVGDGVDYEQGDAPNVFTGKQNSARSVTFTGIPYDPDPKERTLRITIRVNLCTTNYNSAKPEELTGDLLIARMLASPPVKHQTSLDSQDARDASAGAADAGITFTTTPSSLDFGPILGCFHYQAIAGSAPANGPLNAGLLGPVPTLPPMQSAKLNFSTLFPGCLRTRSTGFQDVPGQVYYTDAGFTSQALPPAFANFGSEFQAVFNNIPAGVSVFVQTSLNNPAGTFKLTSAGTAAGSTGLTQLPVTNGSATAIWETQSADPTQTATFAFPVYFAFQSGAPAPSNISVVQSLGSPSGGVSFYQPPASLIQPILFSINTSATTTPTLTAVVDSRPCIIGPVFFSGNACSPTNGLFVNVFSDTAPVQENIATFTAAEGLTNFALTPFATTPSQSEIFPKAGTASPGVYQEMLNITAQGGVKALSIPFNVTLLPANNPIAELNGIADSFSYRSSKIAPGQIFTLFGSNFGPARVAIGPVDKSGKLAAKVANTQVMFDDIAAPLLYVANGQLSGVAPFELAGKTSTSMQLISNGLMSPVVTVPVEAASISIASADGSGGNGAALFNKDGKRNTISDPASVGDTVVFFASYAGPFANGLKGTDGRTTISAPYPKPNGPVSITFGGVPATKIEYFGNAPGLLESVMQINVKIPAGVKPGPYVPLVVSAGGATSVPWTTIAIQ